MRGRKTLRTLIMEIGGYSTTAEYVEHILPNAEYRAPASKAEFTYRYNDKDGELVKEVLRFPDKTFQQRRRVKGAWVYSGCRPMLYELPGVKHAKTIAIVEGEKDADTVNNLVRDDVTFASHGLVTTTSGSASSWKDEFADEFIGKKQMVIMTDDDAAGRKYGGEIAASLDARGIPYFRVGALAPGIKDVTEYMETGATRQMLFEQMGPWGGQYFIQREEA
jgi:5S rRNA maturation endonuclease (ribonuclease M5)